MLLSGSLQLDDWMIGVMQRWPAPLLWLSCCSLYWLSSAPTCSWSLNGLGRKLECNHARYWEDRAKTPGEQTTECFTSYCQWRLPAPLHLQLSGLIWIHCWCVSVSHERGWHGDVVLRRNSFFAEILDKTVTWEAGFPHITFSTYILWLSFFFLSEEQRLTLAA